MAIRKTNSGVKRLTTDTQIDAQRKGRDFEKKVSCVGTRSKAENYCCFWIHKIAGNISALAMLRYSVFCPPDAAAG
ncbi:MAG TPA: hypothetical protein PKA77_18025 [Chitinophagaceae bacterium]|jgi:hypothetical protein|nr:hypothetical protein [Chitinophagaceae bacterium]